LEIIEQVRTGCCVVTSQPFRFSSSALNQIKDGGPVFSREKKNAPLTSRKAAERSSSFFRRQARVIFLEDVTASSIWQKESHHQRGTDKKKMTQSLKIFHVMIS